MASDEGEDVGGASKNRTCDLSIIREIRQISHRLNAYQRFPILLVTGSCECDRETRWDRTGRAGTRLLG